LKGKLFCIGLGPGDPELITLKAVRLMKECPVWVVPQGHSDKLTAQGILQTALDRFVDVERESKEILTAYVPMTRDETVLAGAHEENRKAVEKHLAEGRNVAFFVLGCPTVYASSAYVQKRIAADGYETETVPGITSFSATAAALKTDLCEKEEPLFIIPAKRDDFEALIDVPGNKVIMKPADRLPEIKAVLREKGLIDGASMVERCGLPEEKVYPKLAAAADNSYFSVILVKKGERI